MRFSLMIATAAAALLLLAPSNALANTPDPHKIAILDESHVHRQAQAATPATVTDFILVNTVTGKDILLMHDNLLVDLSVYGRKLSVRVEVSDPSHQLGPVAINFDNGALVRTEAKAPYYLAGHMSSKIYTANNLAIPGPHTLTACPTDSSALAQVGPPQGVSNGRRLQLSDPSAGCLTVTFVTAVNSQTIPVTQVTPPSTDVPPPDAGTSGTVSGELRQWHTLTVGFAGPPASETGMTVPGVYRPPSTFADYRLDVTFFHAGTGIQLVVPGYYAGDGNTGNGPTNQTIAGNVWLCHFTPSATGSWNWTATFLQGTNVAQYGGGNRGGFFDGANGTFVVAASDKTGGDLRGLGRLQVDPIHHHLRFVGSGDYFLKVGPDSPLNLLAYDDFDGATNYGNYSKSYAPHEADYNLGDPTFANGKGTALIGAINYLSDKGVNVMSVTTFDVEGDDKNVHPYITPDNQLNFDISKLAQWGVIFDHTVTMGIALRLKFQDAASDTALNGGNLYGERKLYYRELVARFGHHLAVMWDLGEDLTPKQVAERSAYLREIDTYGSPILVRTSSTTADPKLIVLNSLDGVSVRSADVTTIHTTTTNWVDDSKVSHPLVVSNDEQGSSNTGVLPDAEDLEHNSVRQNVLWGNLMGGGAGVQYYFGTSYPESDLTLQDFRSRDALWDQSRYAIEFFGANNIPFESMSNADAMVSAGCWGLATSDAATVVVYKMAGTGVPTINAPNSYSVAWYNPRTGGSLQKGSVTAIQTGSAVSLKNSPDKDDADWVILLQKI